MAGRPKTRRGPPSVNPESPNNKGVGSFKVTAEVYPSDKDARKYGKRRMYSMRLPEAIMDEVAKHAYANNMSAHEWVIKAFIKTLAYEQAVDHILQQEGLAEERLIIDPRPMAEEMTKMLTDPYAERLEDEARSHG